MIWPFRLFNKFKSFTSGFIPWRLIGYSPQFNDYTKDVDKIAAVFSNPALLKIITLQCDLFSMAKVYVYNGERERQNDVALERFHKPNPMQTQSQFLWDYMFWKMLGNATLYMDSNVVDRTNAPMYWLEPHKIEWPVSLEKEKDKLIFSEAKLNRLLETEIVYRYDDGSTFRFPLKKISTITDLTNGTGNWFKGFSRIDALYKVISNSEVTLDSININTRFTSKFLVAGQADPKDVTRVPMGEAEKKDIEDKINGNTWDEKMKGEEKQVHAVKSMVDVKRFIDDMRALELDKRFLSDFFLIGSMYNIPRDVLELYTSSTYENQDRARAGHVAYTLDPAGCELGAIVSKRWGYTTKDVVLSWDHLPFVQTMEADRMKVKQQQAQVFVTLIKNGVTVDDANKFLDTSFTVEQPQEQPVV
jgi:hypothetical protein